LKKRSSQTVNQALFILILAFCGCTSEEPDLVKLDFDLKTYFLLIDEGNNGSARVRLRQFMEENGQSGQALFLMGLSYHSENRYAKAVEWLLKSTTAEKKRYPQAWHYLGWSHFYLGNIGLAKEAFEHFLVLHPNEPDSTFALGLLAIEAGELESAKELFARVVSIAPQNQSIRAKATSRWADVLVELNDREGAVRLYNDALQRNPDLYEAWYRLSQALNRLGEKEKSKEALKQYQEARLRVHPAWKATRFPE